ncbi:MAG: glycogen/starch/alpha-glucan phosphorylase, partial [Ruminococcaceae bacterium]|nr:glycogen/starch/alpha-glucan phosphorylase [Oscillospiraceae bacterium]
MMNGAITLGTLDGANVEIQEAVGRDNIYIFGHNTHEVEELWRNGYTARDYYHSSPVLKGVIDRLYRPIAGQDFSHIADYLINGGYGVADPFMCLADFESYMYAHKKAVNDYSNKDLWSKMSLMNTATSGVFASDNSINNYAKDIWHIKPINKI